MIFIANHLSPVIILTTTFFFALMCYFFHHKKASKVIFCSGLLVIFTGLFLTLSLKMDKKVKFLEYKIIKKEVSDEEYAKFSRSPFKIIRAMIAEDYQTPRPVLKSLISDQEVAVSEQALKNLTSKKVIAYNPDLSYEGGGTFLQAVWFFFIITLGFLTMLGPLCFLSGVESSNFKSLSATVIGMLALSLSSFTLGKTLIINNYDIETPARSDVYVLEPLIKNRQLSPLEMKKVISRVYPSQKREAESDLEHLLISNADKLDDASIKTLSNRLPNNLAIRLEMKARKILVPEPVSLVKKGPKPEEADLISL